MKKKKSLPLFENVEIIDVAAEGNSIAKVGEMVVFVPFGAPGDVVDIRITKKRRNYAEGRIVAFRLFSSCRVEPFCEHFTDCGGCKWQHIPYQMQLQYKQKQVCDALTRIGKVELPEISPILGSEKTECYRNKLEFTFSNHRWRTQDEILSTLSTPDEVNTESVYALGFHIPGRFDKVLDIRRCLLQDDINNRIRLFVKRFCIDNGFAFFDLRHQTGLMRTLVIRTSSAGDVMVIVVFHHDDEPKRRQLLDAIKETFPEITSLMYVINGKLNDSFADLEAQLYSGKDFMIEKIENLQFKVGPKSFYQTNSIQAYRLYSVAREFAALTGTETVYDLYTGAGTIADFIAGSCSKVIGIEYVAEAIEDAKSNAALNGITNAEFFAGDMKDILTDAFIAVHGRPDVIITDPPRNGMHDDVIDTLISAAPSRIVYVSCNPATQARDINRLDPFYRVARVQPVDMFPHTHHVENVVLLVKKC
ncbi:MAG: 23S rRNA (uracil(1939)-C(5))-methyltransferase RlmD [Tannerella sp.]|nr:23S rRNA (uracil(1939)-C(5))-methyltransferase RlmD [Tannerella sp.]